MDHEIRALKKRLKSTRDVYANLTTAEVLMLLKKLAEVEERICNKVEVALQHQPLVFNI